MTQREKHAAMMHRIAEHGRFLIRTFNLPETTDPIVLCKSLRQIERKVSNASLKACNCGDDGITLDRAIQSAEGNIMRLFRQVPAGFFVNTDPRGYALKIETEHTPSGMYTDMGGYGILAPDLTEAW